VSASAPAAVPAAPAVAKAPTVELLEPGAEPRQQLRLAIPANGKEAATMTMSVRTSISAQGATLPEQAMKVSVRISSVAGTPEGELTPVAFTYGKFTMVPPAGAPAAAAQQMQAMLDEAASLKGSFKVDKRGFVSDPELDTSGLHNPMLVSLMSGMKQSIQQMSNPLPEEAVGVGARWRTTHDLDSMGMKIKQAAVYKVLKLSPTSAVCEIEVTQIATPSAIEVPNQPGLKTFLDSLTGSGKGKANITLSRVFPNSSLSLTSQVDTRVEAPPDQGGTQRVKTNMSMDMTLVPN
jgi:hypothetical protein